MPSVVSRTCASLVAPKQLGNLNNPEPWHHISGMALGGASQKPHLPHRPHRQLRQHHPLKERGTRKAGTSRKRRMTSAPPSPEERPATEEDARHQRVHPCPLGERATATARWESDNEWRSWGKEDEPKTDCRIGGHTEQTKLGVEENQHGATSWEQDDAT